MIYLKNMLTLFSKSSALSLIALGSELYNLAPIKKKPFLANSSLTFGIRKRMFLFLVLALCSLIMN